MTVHLFGNGLSPAVATYGLRRTFKNGEELGPGEKEFLLQLVSRLDHRPHRSFFSWDLHHDELPAQHSLSVFWDQERDVIEAPTLLVRRPRSTRP